MSQKVYAILPNRNLLTTLKGTVDFLLKDPRVNVIIYDQDSSYEPLLEYYTELPERAGVIYTKANGGPNSAWDPYLAHYRENYFVIADPDCDYIGVPDDWLDKMIGVLETTSAQKVGFSLRIDDLPDNDYTREVKNWESKFWAFQDENGWRAQIDSTFALYKPNSAFTYEAIRLPEPYCIRHVPWYLTKETITPEWVNYIKESSSVSHWGNKLKFLL